METLENWESEIIENFGEEWLLGTSSHIIQKLWQRKDEVAKLELMTLAGSLRRVKESVPDINTFNALVKSIKRIDEGEQQGTYFEIVGAASLIDYTGQSAQLYPSGHITTDCFLPISSDKKMHISMKSFQRSDNNKVFSESSKKLASEIPKLLKTHNKNSGAFIVKCGEFPNDKNFDFIYSSLNKALSNHEKDTFMVEENNLQISY